MELLCNATDNLIHQQFYLDGKDIIIGRTAEVQVKIQYSGQIISKFKDIFNENLDLFFKKQYLKFLKKFKKIQGINDSLIKEIYHELNIKMERLEGNVEDSDENSVIFYTILLNTLITKIREIHFKNSLELIHKKVLEENSSIKPAEIDNELTNLFMRNNSNVSILYNISYMHALAKTFNYKQVKRVCSIQRTKYINNTAKLIESRLRVA
ncbi:MAG: hypothetical protein BAJALOKI2v1_90029 [Promethearchaeota archaeon]|nr:MAG: hypothetical protein BAJALOKI2v1_90029 [Candidatus Lokiarchaeota archaeon]